MLYSLANVKVLSRRLLEESLGIVQAMLLWWKIEIKTAYLLMHLLTALANYFQWTTYKHFEAFHKNQQKKDKAEKSKKKRAAAKKKEFEDRLAACQEPMNELKFTI